MNRVGKYGEGRHLHASKDISIVPVMYSIEQDQLRKEFSIQSANKNDKQTKLPVEAVHVADEREEKFKWSILLKERAGVHGKTNSEPVMRIKNRSRKAGHYPMGISPVEQPTCLSERLHTENLNKGFEKYSHRVLWKRIVKQVNC